MPKWLGPGAETLREAPVRGVVFYLKRLRASGDVLFAALLLGLVGWYLFEKGDLAEARATKEESLAVLRDDSLAGREKP